MSQTLTVKATVTRVPELRYTKTQKPILTVPVAVNKSVKQQDGTWANELDFYLDITLWGDQAINGQGTFQVGDKIVAEGPIRLSAYVDKSGAAQASLTMSPKKLGLEVSYGLPERFSGGAQPQQQQPQPQAQAQQQQWAQPQQQQQYQQQAPQQQWQGQPQQAQQGLPYQQPDGYQPTDDMPF